MRRPLWLGTVVLLGLSVVTSAALAGPNEPHVNWGTQVNPARCPTDAGYRYLEINITHHVVNDADSGTTRYWAFDDYNKHIQVWAVGIPDPGPGDAEVFCALVHYQGSWTTTAGASPQDTDTIAAGLEGTFQGGYRAAIVGVINEHPSFKTRGSIGTFNYGATTPDSPAPMPFDWLSAYFTRIDSFSLEWWGFDYNGGHNGRWANSIDGNEGDITD